jgi:hypothetical protein
MPRRPPPPTSGARGFAVALVLLVLLGAALVFFLQAKDREKAVQAETKTTEQANPFADMPPEQPPAKRPAHK